MLILIYVSGVLVGGMWARLNKEDHIAHLTENDRISRSTALNVMATVIILWPVILILVGLVVLATLVRLLWPRLVYVLLGK